MDLVCISSHYVAVSYPVVDVTTGEDDPKKIKKNDDDYDTSYINYTYIGLVQRPHSPTTSFIYIRAFNRVYTVYFICK